MPDALIRFYNGNYFNTIKASSSLASNPVFTLPIDDGDTGEILKTDGNGVLDWTVPQVKNFINGQTGAVGTTTTTIPLDDTIPQNTEGAELMTLAFTPLNSNNKLFIDVTVMASSSTASRYVIAALFQDSTANALAVGYNLIDSVGGVVCTTFSHVMTAGTTNATTFKVRGGLNDSGTFTFNGRAGSRDFGGVLASSIRIWELAA